jgi:hypothetical protein
LRFADERHRHGDQTGTRVREIMRYAFQRSSGGITPCHLEDPKLFSGGLVKDVREDEQLAIRHAGVPTDPGLEQTCVDVQQRSQLHAAEQFGTRA